MKLKDFLFRNERGNEYWALDGQEPPRFARYRYSGAALAGVVGLIAGYGVGGLGGVLVFLPVGCLLGWFVVSWVLYMVRIAIGPLLLIVVGGLLAMTGFYWLARGVFWLVSSLWGVRF